MDTIAHRLGLDPLELRLKNLLRSGDRFATGETMHDVYFVECLEAVAEGIGWKKGKKGEREHDNKEIRNPTGLGLAVMMKSTIPSSRSECRLALDAEGRVTLYTSTVEMGQGTHTALAQITAGAMGVPLEAVTVVGPDTAQTPYNATTSASRGTSMMGDAVMDGTCALKEKLKAAAAPFLEAAPAELTAADGFVFVTDEPGMRPAYADVLRGNEIDTLEVTGSFET